MTRKPSLGAIFLTVFLDVLGFSLVLPFLAAIARSEYGTSEDTGTLLSSVYSLMQFLFVPVWGRLSDRIGRRPVLLVSVLCTAAGMALLGGSLALHIGVWALFACRIASGIATANLGTASAYIADCTTKENRARGMGLIGMGFGFGFVVGPALGGLLSPIVIMGHKGAVPCFVAAGLSVVNFVWVWSRLGESLPPEKRSTKPRSLTPLNVTAMKDAFARPGVLPCVIVNFVLTVGFASLDQTFRFFNEDKFHLTEIGTGIVFTFIGVVAALVQGGLVRPLSKRVQDTSMIRSGTLIQGIAFALVALSPRVGLWGLYAAGGVLALGNGLTQPSVSAYVSKRAGDSEQGGVLGVNQSAAALGRVFGPFIGGVLYKNVSPEAPYWGAALGMLVGLGLTLRLTPSAPETPSAPVAPTKNEEPA
jgi:MFS family permease